MVGQHSFEVKIISDDCKSGYIFQKHTVGIMATAKVLENTPLYNLF